MSAAAKQLRLPPMPKISDLIRMYGLRAKKQLSQNFILDLNVTDKIARKADVFDCHVIEVGSGPGSLTRSLLNNGVKHVHGVEIDERFLPSLEVLRDASHNHLTIHHQDIMTFDMMSPLRNKKSVHMRQWESEELPNMRLVGNLPFAVSIPLLLQWLQAVAERKGPFQLGRVPMTLVFQKEVGQNLVAEEFNYHRSRLSIMAQTYCHVTKEMVLRSTVFTPEPQVDAWLIHFVPRIQPKVDVPFDILEQVVKAIFSKRKKIIRHSIKELFPQRGHLADQLLHDIDIEPTVRPHQLTLEQYNSISTRFVQLCQEHGLTTEPLKINKPNVIR